MDNKLFKETFSAVHAPDTTIEEVLKMTDKKKSGGFGRGMARAVLIAAIVLALAATVFAAAEIRNQNRDPNRDAVKAGSVETDDEVWFTPTNTAGNSYERRMHEIYLDVEMYPDAPQSVDVFYLPQVPEDHGQIHGYLYRDRMSVSYSWKAPGEFIDFAQTAGANYDPSEVIDVIWTKQGVEPEVELTEIAGMKGYLVREEPTEDSSGRRTFHWSDGNYLFRLQVPYEYTDAQLEKMVSGVQPVEDVRPYLIGMTAEEKEEALK